MKSYFSVEAMLNYDSKMGLRPIDIEKDRQWTIWGMISMKSILLDGIVRFQVASTMLALSTPA
jgi:hypothetical protein